MTAAALTAPRAPRPTENTPGSFVLAVVMHALLFAALWINVQWRTQPQGDVVAELWGALPPPVEVAPPPPPIVERAPEPEQRDADIVVKQEALKKKEEEKRAADQRRLDEARRRAEEDKRKSEELKRKVEEEKRAAAERDAVRKAEQQRMLAQAGGAPATGGAGRSGDASYIGLLVGLIKPRIVFAVPEGTSAKIHAQVQVDLLPTGEILAVKVLKPSGLPGYDAAVERAIRRTDPFPRKRDGTIDRTITIDFYPVDAQ
jgi:colicin import membrane protein